PFPRGHVHFQLGHGVECRLVAVADATDVALQDRHVLRPFTRRSLRTGKLAPATWFDTAAPGSWPGGGFALCRSAAQKAAPSPARRPGKPARSPITVDLLQGDKAEAKGGDRHLRAVVHAHLPVDVADMVLDRVGADEQRPRDLIVAEPPGDQLQHVQFPGRQLLEKFLLSIESTVHVANPRGRRYHV